MDGFRIRIMTEQDVYTEARAAAENLRDRRKLCDETLHPLVKIAGAFTSGKLAVSNGINLLDMSTSPPYSYSVPSHDEVHAAVAGLQDAKRRAETARDALPADVTVDGLPPR